MTTLDITIKGTSEVLIDPPVPLPSSEAGMGWDAISRVFLVYAFAGRAACIIADDYRASDQGYLEFVERREEITVDGVLYQLGFSDNCSPNALKAIVGTSDVWWDAVWIAGFSDYNEGQVIKLIQAFTDACYKSKTYNIETKEELLVSTGDGCGFWWTNPGKPIDEIVVRVSHFAQSVGWSVNLIS